AAAVDILCLGEDLQQLAVAAADIEHARAMLNHVGHHQKVDARRTGNAIGMGVALLRRAGNHGNDITGNPRACAAPSRQPRTMANNSGSSSRKASCPLSVTISAKETRAFEAFRACTMARDSDVGNSQSDVKETTQMRVCVSLNALAS